MLYIHIHKDKRKSCNSDDFNGKGPCCSVCTMYICLYSGWMYNWPCTYVCSCVVLSCKLCVRSSELVLYLMS